MGRETCFYCVLNAENPIINQRFYRLTRTHHPNEMGLKVTSGGPEAPVTLSEEVLILQTRNGFLKSAAVSFPLLTRPITANTPDDCVPAASRLVCGPVSAFKTLTFLRRLLKIYL